MVNVGQTLYSYFNKDHIGEHLCSPTVWLFCSYARLSDVRHNGDILGNEEPTDDDIEEIYSRGMLVW